VLVPRPDSETVIEAVLALMPDRDSAWRILDLGLGSGCLLLTSAARVPAARGIGLETSPEALAVAQENAQRLGVPTGRGWWPATGASRVGKGYWLDRSI
jgi:release factor glutamine methyltransferase